MQSKIVKFINLILTIYRSLTYINRQKQELQKEQTTYRLICLIWNDDYLKRFNWCFKILIQRLELFVSPTRFTSKERIEWIWYFNRVVKIIFWLWRTLTKHALCALFCTVLCLLFTQLPVAFTFQRSQFMSLTRNYGL